MEYTSSRRGKILFRKIPLTEFFIRHHINNNNSDQHETTTRLPLANQQTRIIDSPFSFFSFFIFSFFNLEFPFSFVFFLFFPFLEILEFFLFWVLRWETGWDNFFFFVFACK